MDIFLFSSFAVLTIYFLLIVFFYYGWNRTYHLIEEHDISIIPVSVIVALRNEERIVDNLIKSLTNQHYPKDFLEIILINDHSQDATFEKLLFAADNFNNIKILDAAEGMAGKKMAQSLGLKKANGQLIVFTDADCMHPENWIRTFIKYHQHTKADFLVGPVSIQPEKGFLNRFQSIELMSLVGSTGGAIGINHPVMCNGANLAITKKLVTYFNKQGNQHPSGDDVFLLLTVKKLKQFNICFIRHRHAVVKTTSAPTFREFLNQRIRWTSKSRMYRDFDIIFVALLVLLTNLILLVNFLLGFYKIYFLYVFASLFLFKSIIDHTFLNRINQLFSFKKIGFSILGFQFAYIFYISFTGIFGNIVTFSWKNRNYKN